LACNLFNVKERDKGRETRMTGEKNKNKWDGRNI
jgi:hypothetical protein